MKYDAFISYSHNDDTRIAKAIQDNLHRLAKRWDSLSAIRVFRDTTHLPVTALQPALVGALADSKFLILLASPKSAASNWVCEELARFLETHSPERVLIVLIDGDLVWDELLAHFAPGPTSACPPVDAYRLDTEPLFLDLRWAVGESNLSLSNPRFLDAVATLAATLQEVPKETLVGDLVEEHRRARRNQRVNLGFRGAAGFGIAAAIFFLLGAAFSITSDAVSAPSAAGYLYFAIGFPAIGAIGALCCGVGWRGTMSFAVGFLVLVPFYVMSSFRPFESSLSDYLTLTVILLTGFVAAGTVGAAGCPRIRWSDGAKAFGCGGSVVAALWLVLDGFRPEGIHTALAAWPWLPTRFWLLGQRALEFVADVFAERETGMLIPLIVGVIAGGLLFGVRLADARMATEVRRAGAKADRVFSIPKSHLVGRVLIAALVSAIVAWSFSLRDAYQIAAASRALDIDTLRPLLFAGEENIHGSALTLALRARNALERRGEHGAAEQFVPMVRDAIQNFARSLQYYDRHSSPGYRPPDISEIAQTLNDFGRPQELAHLFEIARGQLKDADALSTIAAARAERTFGSKEMAADALRSAVTKVKPLDWFERSLLAQAFFELGHVDVAKDMLRKLSADITERFSRGSTMFLSDALAPESGDSLWRTGLWNELPEWREQLSDVLATAIEGMCRRGELESAALQIRNNRTHTGLWHAHARFAKAAAQAQQYDTAFAVLDALEPESDPGWTSFNNRVAGLIEIITSAVAYRNAGAIQKAVALLRKTESEVRERSELNRFAGTKIAKAYALAGEYEAALVVAQDVTDEPWAADSAIGIALSATGRRSDAASILARAWRGLQDNNGRSVPERHHALSEIGVALARIGEFKAARRVADDIGSDFAHYSGGSEALAKLSIYVAILEHAPVH